MKNLIALIIAFAVSQNVGMSQYDVSLTDDHRDWNLLSMIESDEWMNPVVEPSASSRAHSKVTLEENMDIVQSISLDMNSVVVDDLNLKISMNLKDVVEVRLYDEEGTQVKNLRGAETLSAGKSELNSNLESLDSGNYLLVVFTPSWTSGRTITKL